MMFIAPGSTSSPAAPIAKPSPSTDRRVPKRGPPAPGAAKSPCSSRIASSSPAPDSMSVAGRRAGRRPRRELRDARRAQVDATDARRRRVSDRPGVGRRLRPRAGGERGASAGACCRAAARAGDARRARTAGRARPGPPGLDARADHERHGQPAGSGRACLGHVRARQSAHRPRDHRHRRPSRLRGIARHRRGDVVHPESRERLHEGHDNRRLPATESWNPRTNSAISASSSMGGSSSTPLEQGSIGLRRCGP